MATLIDLSILKIRRRRIQMILIAKHFQVSGACDPSHLLDEQAARLRHLF